MECTSKTANCRPYYPHTPGVTYFSHLFSWVTSDFDLFLIYSPELLLTLTYFSFILLSYFLLASRCVAIWKYDKRKYHSAPVVYYGNNDHNNNNNNNRNDDNDNYGKYAQTTPARHVDKRHQPPIIN